MGTSSNGRVDQAAWDRLLEAYREDPGNHSNAARQALVQRRTAKRAWSLGYPDRPWGVKPIKQLIMEDVDLARAKSQLEAEREGLAEQVEELEADRDREASRQRAVVVRKEEGFLIGLSRQAAIRSMAAATESLNGLKAAMTRLGLELDAISQGGPISPKQLGNLSQIARRYAATVRDITLAGQTSMEMERLYQGEPQEIIGVTTELDAMPTEELVKMAGYGDAVLKRAAERGLIVLDGGLKKATGQQG